MRKLLFFIFIAVCFQAKGQISQDGTPYSLQLNKLKAKVNLPLTQLAKLDTVKLNEEDTEYPTPYRYSIIKETAIDIKQGLLTELPNNEGKIWRYEIAATNAKSIQLYFSRYVVPQGAKLFVYNATYSEIYGAFTSDNMQIDSTFIIADFPSDDVIVEYYEPNNVAFEGKLIIGKIGQAYRDVMNNPKASNYVNINCDEGANWQDVKHAVCKITFQESGSGYICTGTLLNNTNLDQTPYFLTANHCLNTETVAKTLVAYFNYENEGCSGAEKRSKTLTGSSLLNTSSQSDYTLLKLSTNVPVSYQPFYAGWDRSGKPTLGAVGIHHPEGFSKKISVTTDSVIIYNGLLKWDGSTDSPISSHWKLLYTDGKTAGGSSGSALFDKNKRVIGQLHGGDATYDFYGRLFYSWTVGQRGSSLISSYLDPSNSGVTTLDGFAPLAIKPSAYFQLASSVVCKDAPFSISDKSVFNATSWKWVVTPSTAIFVDGTSATSQNPVLTFSDIDIPYTIKLIVTNANGADSLTLNNALSASNTLALSATTTPNNEICFCKFDSIQLKGHGADEYSWSISKPENRIYFPTATGQNVAAKLVNNAATESSFTFDIQLIGKQATCIDTVTIPYTVVKPSNDDIQNAITLQTGVSQTYSNKCASIQTNEPHPAITSCTSQTSWCDEYGDGTNIIENTLWFKVIGPDSGILGIKSTGMDDELALYKAATSSDILSGKGVLLAANDDATDIDSNPTLKSVSVTPGQIYWLQVDGSGGGSIGEFTLTVSDTALSTALVTTENKDQLAAYPQPVSDILTLTGLSALKGDAIFTIYSMTGRTVFTHQSSLYNNATQQINVANFAPGMYLLRITINKQVYSLRFIKK